MDDPYWEQVVRYLREQDLLDTKIIAPHEFSEELMLAGDYRNPSPVAQADVFVIHKGRYDEIGAECLREALERCAPRFSNEVFLVFTRDHATDNLSTEHLSEIDKIRARYWSDDAPTPCLAPKVDRMAALYMGAHKVLLENMFGHLMLASSTDTSITPHMIRDGYFDRGLTELVNRALRPGMVYVDIGANIGAYAVPAAGIVGPRGKVLAIEALPRLAGMLRESFGMNGFGGHSEVLAIAAGAEVDSVTMHEFGTRQGSSTSVEWIAEAAVGDYGETVRSFTTACRPLDAIIAERGITRLDFLKIDVEGAELAVLNGGLATIGALMPSILFEWHNAFISEADASALHHLLVDRLGYRLARVEADGRIPPVDLRELLARDHSDVLAAPPGRRRF